MTVVACVKVGTRYGADYVNKLYDGVIRNLSPTTPVKEFVCFTDDATGLDPLITVRQVPKDLAGRGWWAKLFLFSDEAFAKGEHVVYFDLDTVITGPLDFIAQYKGDFAILRDAYRENGWQSSVMMWKAGERPTSTVWREWSAEGCPDMFGGDQAAIEKYAPRAELLQDLFPGRFRSYKVDCRASIPKGCSVVFFHGNPRPHEVTTGWVPEVWKVGGGSGLEFIVQANTTDDALLTNVRAAIKRNCRWLKSEEAHKGSALIVGGGPSLAENLFYIQGMQRAGSKIFATNATYAYLVEHGIQPDAHVMLDARAENLAFVPKDATPKYYASQCHPDVLDAAGDALTCWHAAYGPYHDAVASHETAEVMVGGGTTVGLKAIAVAYSLGYRDLRLFGFDSSYREDAHHAYAQTLNDGERVVTANVGGKAYKAAAWMVAQAEEFKELAVALAHVGCVVTVYGDGLLPAVAQEMSRVIAEVDGLYWPSQDSETRASVLSTLGDARTYVDYCLGSRVVVQAGGNVGVWPKEFAKYFDTVYTFEPDPINWECLRKNVSESNIVARHAALGSKPGRVAIAHDGFNCGASNVVDGDEVSVVTIDELALPACDLIQLDVEGYELEALKGAEATIRRHSPVIVLELKGLGERYGASDDDTRQWLAGLGYTASATHHRDVVFTRSH